jgi:hypothetical protein
MSGKLSNRKEAFLAKARFLINHPDPDVREAGRVLYKRLQVADEIITSAGGPGPTKPLYPRLDDLIEENGPKRE